MKLLRTAFNMKPAEVSDYLGIERTYWSRSENGKRQIPDALAVQLVARFGVTLDWLILGRWDKLSVELADKLRSAEAEVGPPPPEK